VPQCFIGISARMGKDESSEAVRMMKTRNGNSTSRTHRHRWKTVLVCSRGTKTQRCDCKAYPECGAMRQVGMDGYGITLRPHLSLEMQWAEAVG
jgi:hypothetical protein